MGCLRALAVSGSGFAVLSSVTVKRLLLRPRKVWDDKNSDLLTPTFFISTSERQSVVYLIDKSGVCFVFFVKWSDSICQLCSGVGTVFGGVGGWVSGDTNRKIL